jgi:hypothetical protein
MSSKRLACLFLTALGVMGIHSVPLIGQEQCLTDAWNAKKAGNHDAAIRAADECINSFASAAKKTEDGLKNKPVIKPGRLSAPDRAKALDQGLLNDVAAAYIVKGEAAEVLAKNNAANADLQQGYNKLAIDAYEAALVYRHALVSDGRSPESFWSPCIAAANHLKNLTKTDHSQVCH